MNERMQLVGCVYILSNVLVEIVVIGVHILQRSKSAQTVGVCVYVFALF